MLGQVTSLALEGPASWAPLPGLELDSKELAGAVREHAATTSELRQLCQDLQVGFGDLGV